MTKIFMTGEIVDLRRDGCFSPQDLKEKLEAIGPKEDLEVEITSEGGSVFAGMQIANMLARHEGKVTTHAMGICASIATVILMAGDKVCVDENCFCLVHLPWTTCQGNAKDMLKEIDALKKCETAMMGYYTKHSKVPTEVLAKYLEDETWFLGNEFAEVFDCEVVASGKVLNIAAKIKKFKNMPNKLKRVIKNIESDSTMEKEDNKEATEEVKEETSQEAVEQQEEAVEKTEEQKTDDTMSEEEPVEPEEEKPTYEELEQKVKELQQKIEELEKAASEEKNVSEGECQKRVSGMQAKMQLKINDCEHKYKDLIEVKDKEIKLREEELESIKAEATSLKSKLDESMKNCEDLASALRDKDSALESLNARVLSPAEMLSKKTWRDLEGKEFFDYLKKNNNIIKINKIPNK